MENEKTKWTIANKLTALGITAAICMFTITMGVTTMRNTEDIKELKADVRQLRIEMYQGFDKINSRLDEITKMLYSMDKSISLLDKRISILEERSSKVPALFEVGAN